MNRKLLTKAIPIWSLLLVSMLLTSGVVIALTAVPPVTDYVNELRGRTTILTISDMDYVDIELIDTTDPVNEKADKVKITFTLDTVPDAGLTITVTLKNLAGDTLDMDDLVLAFGDLVEGTNIKTVTMEADAAIITLVKSILIVFA